MSYSSFESNHRNYIKKKKNSHNDEEYPRNNYTVFTINEKQLKHKVKIFQYDYFSLAEKHTMVHFEKEFDKLEKKYLTKQKKYTEGVHLKNGKTAQKYQGHTKDPVYSEYTSFYHLVNPLYSEIKRIKAIKNEQKLQDKNLLQQLTVAVIIYLRMLEKFHDKGCIHSQIVPWIFDEGQHRNNLDLVSGIKFVKKRIYINLVQETNDNDQNIKDKIDNNNEKKKNKKKRSSTAYNKFFSNQYSLKSQQSSSGKTFKQLSPIIADEWKNLDPEQKAKWEKDAKCEKDVKKKKERKRKRTNKSNQNERSAPLKKKRKITTNGNDPLGQNDACLIM